MVSNFKLVTKVLFDVAHYFFLLLIHFEVTRDLSYHSIQEFIRNHDGFIIHLYHITFLDSQ